MAATDHAEGLGRVEASSARDEGNSLLAGVDDITVAVSDNDPTSGARFLPINLRRLRVRTHPENTILRLDPNIPLLGQI